MQNLNGPKETRVTGSIHRREGSKNYYAVIRYPDRNGQMKQQWFSTRTRRKTDANRFLVSKIDEIEASLDADSPIRVKLLDMLVNWRDAYEKLEATTIEGYEQNFDNHVIPYFEKNHKNLLVNEVRRKHIQDFIEHLGLNGRMDGEGGLKKESVKKYVCNLSSIFEHAIYLELIDVNPCYKVKYPMSIFNGKPYEPEYLNLNELLKLLKYVFSRAKLESPPDEYYWGFATGIMLAAFYAMRRGEIYGLKWDRIDMKNNLISINKTWVVQKSFHEKDPKNKASKASMPLVPEVKSFLLRLKQHQDEQKKYFGSSYEDNDLLVTKDCGRRFGICYINNTLQSVLREIGLKEVTQHQLRHSTATLLRSLGYSAQEIQSWLRHADIKSTMRYAHDNIEVKRKAADTLNELFKF